MTVRKIIQSSVLVGAMLWAIPATAQTSPLPPNKPAPPSRAGQSSSDKLPPAPQVVTIIHRLNGLKMFRLLLRSQAQVQAIASLDSAFDLADDVHTNVIAGLTLDDGQTIVAWLPEVEVEFGPPEVRLPRAPRAPRASRSAAEKFPQVLSDVPDVTVIGPDGKRLAATYVGLDGATGLSILRLANKTSLPAVEFSKKTVSLGDKVLLFGPEPVTRVGAVIGNGLFARVGAIEGRIDDVMPTPAGGIARFTISSPKLSHSNIGGVALNQSGETIGIVDGLQDGEARVLPVALVKRAADRVLERKASVPRPWLGVNGEAVAALKFDEILHHGWELKRAAALANNHLGIMLTSIVPGSPAESAALRAGDVILKVDQNEIQTADDFTWWLEQAGPSSDVEFTVLRPDRPSEEPLNVKLSGMLDRSFNFSLTERLSAPRRFSLMDQGIETIALRPLVAAQLGTTAGLLVVYVDPVTAAFEAGLQPGDVIQMIDGKPVSTFKPSPQAASFTFSVVRKKQKFVIKIPARKRQ